MGNRILVVEDDSVTRKFLTFILGSDGFEVIPARDGIEALEKLGGGQVDLVLTDLNMPRMDGVELIRSIRASEAHAALPVLLLTTESDMESRSLGLDAGASEYILKPVSKEALTHTVRAWLSREEPIPSERGGAENG